MNKFAIFKTGIGLSVGVGVSKIAKTIIDNHVYPVTPLEKVLCGLGRMGIAMTAGAVVTKHVDQELDNYKAMYDKVTKQVKEAPKK